MKYKYITPLIYKYKKGTMPDGWELKQHTCDGDIIVSHIDGSGVVIKKDSGLIVEQLFYRMMDQILKGGE